MFTSMDMYLKHRHDCEPRHSMAPRRGSHTRRSRRPPRVRCPRPFPAYRRVLTARSDEEIRAILPQAEDFEREPIKVTVLNFNPLAEPDPGTTGDVPKGGCKTAFGLPAEYESAHNSNVRIVFQSVADPALVAKGYAIHAQPKRCTIEEERRVPVPRSASCSFEH